MQIGYSESTLLLSIIRQAQEIASEARWIEYYGHNSETECIEDCVKNIRDSLEAILEDIDYLKGEPL